MSPNKDISEAPAVVGIPAVIAIPAVTAIPAVIDAAGVCQTEAAQIKDRQAAMLGPGDHPVLGVSFSGGGIRSATFNLGIIQGMAECGVLPRIDYLSTVSGGGYIGTWLHGVIQRYGDGNPHNVREVLTRPEDHPHRDASVDPIGFLRKYSSYLAPEMGLFSADFWVVGGIWMRNMLLNQLILLPFLAAMSMLTFFVGSSAGWYVSGHDSTRGEVWLTLLLLTVIVWIAGEGVGSVAIDGASECAPGNREASAGQSRWDSVGTATLSAVLMLLAALCLALSSHAVVDPTWVQDRLGFIAVYVPPESHWIVGAAAMGLVITVFFAVLQWKGKFLTCFRNRHEGARPWFGFWGYPLAAGVPTGFLIFGAMKILDKADYWTAGSWNTVAWGPPLLAATMLAGCSLHIGLMGVDYEDNAREWLARVGAFVGLFSFAWAALFTISVYGPYWITQMAAVSWGPVAGLGGGWILTSVAGALSGTSSKTPAKPEQRSSGGILGFISKVAPTVFMIGYLLVISLGLHIALAQLCGIRPKWVDAGPPPATLQVTATAAGVKNLTVNVKNTGTAEPPAIITMTAAREKELIEFGNFDKECVVALEMLLCALAVVWYLPRRIDINEFSMNHFYKNRLVRCYLGATKGRQRRPSRFTGFDPHDDLPLADLLPKKKYYGPFALINVCLNLNRGTELAKRERKGSSFIFTPLYTGYDPPGSDEDSAAQSRRKFFSRLWRRDFLHPEGYRITEGYGYPQGYAIGTCMAISGAAANPNGGYHTSRPMAFLMTLFNVRLGWWSGNTRRDFASSRPGPRHSLMALLSELFAATDARSNYVNLSDGGHFENLGLYELVRRRCQYIITGDGEQDDNYTFESLGEAIRKCRTDFGAEIEVDPRRIRPTDGLSTTHCVVGKIRYALREGETTRSTGWLLYLKASLTGDEPQDVAQYKSSHPAFPQEPTSNQFFTESQFESYRKLGRHVWESAFENITPEVRAGDLETIYTWLYRIWYPPTDVKEGVESKHAAAYSALMNKLSGGVLERLKDQVMAPEGQPDFVAEMPPLDEADKTGVLLYTLELIQLMENVWVDLRMAQRANRESPANAGWMGVFRYWSRQPMFQEAWRNAGYSYNPLFQQFYRNLSQRPN